MHTVIAILIGMFIFLFGVIAFFNLFSDGYPEDEFFDKEEKEEKKPKSKKTTEKKK